MKISNAEMVALEGAVEEGGIEKQLQGQFFELEAKGRLDKFVTDNDLESKTLVEQAEALKQYLESVVDDLRMKTSLGGDSVAEKNERRVMRQLVEKIAEALYNLHLVENIGRSPQESQTYLINS